MSKYFIFIALFIASAIKSYGQYTIRTLDETDGPPSGTLAKNEILIVCLVNPSCTVQCSVDKSMWRSRNISYESTIEVTLDDEYPYFYVQIDENTLTSSSKYRLTPGRKYKLAKDFKSGQIIIRSGR